MSLSCHLCRGQLDEFEHFSSLYQVTSDCRPWAKGGHLCICRHCGSVQKLITKQWLMDVEYIYDSYNIYNQASGKEQNAFDQIDGNNEARSMKIVSWLSDIKLPKSGTLLDVGCGNGAFLKSFSKEYPKYKLSGLEINDKNKDEIESINGVEKLYIGDIDSVNRSFDFISIVHTLEHILDPIQYLISLSNKLNKGGLLFIEVPNLKKSPFDLLILDHCTHFDLESLKEVVIRSGFKLIKSISDYIPKELSFLCQWSGFEKTKKNDKPAILKKSFNKKRLTISNRIDWLQQFATDCNKNSDFIGIFGTSISATWLAVSIGDKVKFFVDEDVNRIGKTHLGKPIYSPNDFQLNGKKILMPFRKDIASNICNRYKTLDFVIPN